MSTSRRLGAESRSSCRLLCRITASCAPGCTTRFAASRVLRAPVSASDFASPGTGVRRVRRREDNCRSARYNARLWPPSVTSRTRALASSIVHRVKISHLKRCGARIVTETRRNHNEQIRTGHGKYRSRTDVHLSVGTCSSAAPCCPSLLISSGPASRFVR